MTITHLDAHTGGGRAADKHQEALDQLRELAPQRADLSPRQRADVAEALVQFSRGLVYAVREEGPDQIERMLSAGELQPFLRDLAIVLACLVPDDRTFEELLSWVTWDWEPMGPPAPDERRSA